ncbi:hypothetical protein [Salinibacterium sp.]|uniref:hypothetical protein n=1 Tax=Salinibacterium sp. TaxID=1915057 RepID=UPI00286A9238|nr:hypothetical protein [Salinibacterium sp.]
MSSPLTAEAAGPGRTRITARALDRVVSAVTAEALGVDRAKVSVDLEDDGGALTLIVRAPIHIISLERSMADPGAVTRAGGSVISRAARAQETIRTRIQSLTGSNISRVQLRLTSAHITQERRVT